MAQLPKALGASTQNLVNPDSAPVKHSGFDYSRVTNLTGDYGAIIPFDFFFTYPGDHGKLSTEIIVQSFPQITNNLTPVTLHVAWYYARLFDLFEGAEVLMTKGRRNNLNLNVPKTNLDFDPFADSYSTAFGNTIRKHYTTSHSLASYLGCIPDCKAGSGTYDGENITFTGYYLPSTSAHIKDNWNDTENQTGYTSFKTPNALPFVMYQNIAKYHFTDPNLLEANTALFPSKGDFDWRLPYTESSDPIYDMAGHTQSDLSSFTYPLLSNSYYYTNSDKIIPLHLLRYARWQNDRFTTGLLSPTRGTPTPLAFDVSGFTINSSFVAKSGASTNAGINLRTNTGLSKFINGVAYHSSTDGDSLLNGDVSSSINVNTFNNAVGIQNSTSGTATSTISLANLREMIATTVFMERNARVNGDYNSLIQIQWQQDPHHDEHKSRFIGGYAQPISFQETIQTSSSTSDSPMASSAGRSNDHSQGFCGNFTSDDYGIVMGILYVQPETTYDQGIQHELKYWNVFEDIPLPAFESLSMEPVYKGELFYTGTDTDDELFCWQQRYSYVKSRTNVNRGLFQVSGNSDIMFAGSTIKHLITSSPSYNDAFIRITPENVSRYHLAYPSFPAFKFSIATRLENFSRPFAYTSKPQTFGF